MGADIGCQSTLAHTSTTARTWAEHAMTKNASTPSPTRPSFRMRWDWTAIMAICMHTPVELHHSVSISSHLVSLYVPTRGAMQLASPDATSCHPRDPAVPTHG